MNKKQTFGLKEEELKKIEKLLGREPTLLELGIFALNWSEHCSYKSSKLILKRLPRKGKRTVVSQGENAGIVELKNGWCLAFKVESHNHPSAIEPLHGAATGIGGIVRDILSMGARPIALLDALRFGKFESRKTKWLFEGVVSGIAYYGNCIGVPTVAGDVYFEEAYEDNPLVNVMCVGLLRKEKIRKSIAKGVGNLLILAGATTGRDGIHGATFASEDLIGEEKEKRPNVQIGDPFMGKLLIEATLEALEKPGIIGVQDLGAGGLSTAPAEMAYKGGNGIEIDLAKVPLRAKGMNPYEIILSESQERMVLCVERGKEEEIIEVYKKWGLNAEVIGKVVKEKVLRVKEEDRILTEIPLSYLFDEIPLRKPPAFIREEKKEFKEVNIRKRIDLGEAFLKLLKSPNLSSKEWVWRQYDHTVGTNTVISPGQGDAALLRVKGEQFGFALKIDGNGRYTELDPYEGGKIAVCEAARNLISVGAEPIGITDCLNFGNPEIDEVYESFFKVVMGIKEAAEKLEIPIVSGNVSFYNQSERRRVYPTPTIGMVGLVEDISKALKPGFKRKGDRIYMIGKKEGEIGGSEFLSVLYDEKDGKVDKVELDFEKKLERVVLNLLREGVLSSCHDISEGGLLLAVAEECIRGGKGASLEIKEEIEFLFGEWQSRFIVSVKAQDEKDFLRRLKEEGIPAIYIGEVSYHAIKFGKYAFPLEVVREISSIGIEREMKW